VPLLDTESAVDITENSATVKLSYEEGSYDSMDLWFKYREEGSDAWNKTSEVNRSGGGSYSIGLTGLDPDTTYEYVAYAETHGSPGYVENDSVKTFTTDPPVVNHLDVINTVTDGVKAKCSVDNAGLSLDLYLQYRKQGATKWNEKLLEETVSTENHLGKIGGLESNTYYEGRWMLRGSEYYSGIFIFRTESESFIPPLDPSKNLKIDLKVGKKVDDGIEKVTSMEFRPDNRFTIGETVNVLAYLTADGIGLSHADEITLTWNGNTYVMNDGYSNEFFKEFEIPEGTTPGSYIVTVEASEGGQTASASKTMQVVKEEEFSLKSLILENIYIVLAMLALVTVFLIMLIKS
ncbi:MAG: fibronectin type III domain-containing protein, partial [Candidatus Aenigmatarchaeota archaeon]